MTSRRRAGRIAALLLIGVSGCNLILGIDDFVDAQKTTGVGGGATGGSGGGQVTSCDDGVRNGNETSVDCGGGSCPACTDGEGCAVGPDCASKVCSGGTCLAPSCSDQVKNGDETDIDCGGGCGGCGPEKGCGKAEDCKGGVCEGGSCQPTCTDGEKSGSETGVDCGGGGCAACADGEGCAGGVDCSSGVCKGGVCSDYVVWAKGFGSVMASDITSGAGVAVDGAGSVAMVGFLSGTTDFGGGPVTSAGLGDVLVARFDEAGNHLWSKQFGDAQHQSGTLVKTDNGNNVLVAGQFLGVLKIGFTSHVASAGGIGDFFIAKLSPLGDYIWSRGLGGTGTDVVRGLAIDASDNVITTGIFANQVDFGGGPVTAYGGGDIFLAKLDPSGKQIWSKALGKVGAQRGDSVAATATGDVVLGAMSSFDVDFGGGLISNNGDTDVCVARYDGAGAHLWSKCFGDKAEQDEINVAVDGSGQIYVAGRFNGTIDFGGGPLMSAGGTDLFLAKLDALGAHVWSKHFGDSSEQSNARLSVDGAGNVYLLSTCKGVVDFGGGPLASVGGPVDGADVFVAKFDAAGNHLWSRRFGDTHDQTGGAIATSNLGNVLMTGSFSGALDFNGKTLAAAGTGAFLSKLLTP